MHPLLVSPPLSNRLLFMGGETKLSLVGESAILLDEGVGVAIMY